MIEVDYYPVEMHEPRIFAHDLPIWASHDMACAVCQRLPAILNTADYLFDPCGECQRDGFKLVKYRKGWKRIFGVIK